MIEFLKHGKVLNSIQMGTYVDDVYARIGEPDEIVGDKNYGYLHYKEYRYGYDMNGCITEMSIEFNRLKQKFRFNNLESNQHGIVFYKSFSIGPKTKIHKFIRFLNYLQLNWESNNDSDKDYLTIKIKKGPYVLFDLQDGTPFRVSIMDGYQ